MDRPGASHLEVLFQSLALIGERGTALQARAMANLAFAVISDKGDCTRAEYKAHWGTLRLGNVEATISDAALEASLAQGIVIEKNGKLSVVASGPNLRTLMKEAFPRFEPHLRKCWPDEYDRHIDAATVKAFPNCLEEVFKHAIEMTLANGKIANIDHLRLTPRFRAIAEGMGVRHSVVFAEALADWLRHHYSELEKVGASLLTLCATILMFAKQKTLAHATCQNLKHTTLLVDTNFVIQLLCPKTSTWFETSEEVAALAKLLKIQLQIAGPHLAETRELISASYKILSEGGTNARWIEKDNQLIHEFEAQTPRDLQAFKASLDRFDLTLGQYGIGVIQISEDLTPEVQAIQSALQKFYEATGAARRALAVRRDALVLDYVRLEQTDAAKASPVPTPWLITYDSKLVSADGLWADLKSQTPVCVYAATWLARIQAITQFDDDSAIDLPAIGLAWLGLAINPVHHFTAAEIYDVLVRQLDLPQDMQKRVVEAALKSHLTKQLDEALLYGNVTVAPPLIDSVLRVALEQAMRDLKMRESELADLRGRLRKHLGMES
jgi:hypothetical protein